jgi:hypothetical protein
MSKSSPLAEQFEIWSGFRKTYGRGGWRKLKGKALVRFVGIDIRRVEEVHWYEAHGIGKREIKVKLRPR